MLAALTLVRHNNRGLESYLLLYKLHLITS
jgi:hypothetical protein